MKRGRRTQQKEDTVTEADQPACREVDPVHKGHAGRRGQSNVCVAVGVGWWKGSCGT